MHHFAFLKADTCYSNTIIQKYIHLSTLFAFCRMENVRRKAFECDTCKKQYSRFKPASNFILLIGPRRSSVVVLIFHVLVFKSFCAVCTLCVFHILVKFG